MAKREQEVLTMGAKMKVLEDQQRDSQRHIRLLKDSLIAKEEHYNLLLADVEELKRNLDDRNRLIEKKSYQQTMFMPGAANSGRNMMGKSNQQQYHQELEEMQIVLESKEKKVNELQRKILHLDSLLSDRESQLERTRLNRGVGDLQFEGLHGQQLPVDRNILNHLEESLGDKEKQISLLRDQRDRAEHELNEERDSHERSIKEYKMKLNSMKFEMEKIQVSSHNYSILSSFHQAQSQSKAQPCMS